MTLILDDIGLNHRQFTHLMSFWLRINPVQFCTTDPAGAW
jgi:hypothetical protein